MRGRLEDSLVGMTLVTQEGGERELEALLAHVPLLVAFFVVAAFLLTAIPCAILCRFRFVGCGR